MLGFLSKFFQSNFLVSLASRLIETLLEQIKSKVFEMKEFENRERSESFAVSGDLRLSGF